MQIALLRPHPQLWCAYWARYYVWALPSNLSCLKILKDLKLFILNVLARSLIYTVLKHGILVQKVSMLTWKKNKNQSYSSVRVSLSDTTCCQPDVGGSAYRVFFFHCMKVKASRVFFPLHEGESVARYCSCFCSSFCIKINSSFAFLAFLIQFL